MNDTDSGSHSENVKCPFCKEEIKSGAIKCKHCGEVLNKTAFVGTCATVSQSAGNIQLPRCEQNLCATPEVKPPSIIDKKATATNIAPFGILRSLFKTLSCPHCAISIENFIDATVCPKCGKGLEALKKRMDRNIITVDIICIILLCLFTLLFLDIYSVILTVPIVVTGIVVALHWVKWAKPFLKVLNVDLGVSKQAVFAVVVLLICGVGLLYGKRENKFEIVACLENMKHITRAIDYSRTDDGLIRIDRLKNKLEEKKANLQCPSGATYFFCVSSTNDFLWLTQKYYGYCRKHRNVIRGDGSVSHYKKAEYESIIPLMLFSSNNVATVLVTAVAIMGQYNSGHETEDTIIVRSDSLRIQFIHSATGHDSVWKSGAIESTTKSPDGKTVTIKGTLENFGYSKSSEDIRHSPTLFTATLNTDEKTITFHGVLIIDSLTTRPLDVTYKKVL